MLHGQGSVRELAHASSLCGACAEACPVRIDIPRMLIELRAGGVTTTTAGLGERLVFRALAWLLRRPRLYRLAAPIGRWLQRPFVHGGGPRGLPLFLGRWTRTRDIPAVATRTFSEQWKTLEREG
jgi:L-lactate dehydrogenase complex protein LldF